MVYISRSCFRSARQNTGVRRTDRQTDGQTDGHLPIAMTRASIASRE